MVHRLDINKIHSLNELSGEQNHSDLKISEQYCFENYQRLTRNRLQKNTRSRVFPVIIVLYLYCHDDVLCTSVKLNVFSVLFKPKLCNIKHLLSA
jgi:hypothetical protein